MTPVNTDHDDTETFLADLAAGEPISVLIAPSFRANYPDEYERVLGGLKALGVRHFINVSFGADITTWGYLRYIQEHDFTVGISQPCPAVVTYIEKYIPQLLPSLFPVQSPLMCAAIYARKEMGIMMDRTVQAEELFRRFDEIGIRLLMDDFGTGYSSLGYLTYIPVDVIKLDKSLVDNYLVDGKDAVIDDMIRLIHDLDKEMTIEGVEKEWQYCRLKEFGADTIQGFFFSEPLLPEDAIRFVPGVE